MASTVPAHYSAIPLEFRNGVPVPVASRSFLKVPLQVRKEREAYRAWLAEQPVPRPYTPFFIPEYVLDTREHHQQRQSPLFRLPPELLLLVVEKIEVPYFQVVFGLTCKSIARLLSNNRESLAPWRGFRDKEGLYRLLARQPKTGQSPLALTRQRTSSVTSSSSLDFADLTLTDSQTVDILPYVPNTLRLCRACFRHVPRNKMYWLTKMSSADFDKPDVNWFDILNFFTESQRNCGQHKCPECCVKNYTCFMREAEYERALYEDYRDEEVYLVDLGENGRRVCVELPARLKRP